MPRRMGRPGLLGTMARTAVVAGTATAASGAVREHQAAKQQAVNQPVDPTPPAAPEPAVVEATPAAPEPATAISEQTIAKLRELGELHAAGVLSDDEFAATKATLLGV